MKRFCLILAMTGVLLCAGCGAERSESSAEMPLFSAESTEQAPVGNPEDTEDHILLTLNATVDNNRPLRLEAVGKQRPDMDHWGTREVRVYDGTDLIQTISAQEAIDADGVSGAVGEGYTECWSIEESMTVHDMNFDGCEDLDLFGWICNNTIPHYYWLWDSESDQYVYAFCLQGAKPDPERQEVLSEYKYSGVGYHRDFYCYDSDGMLTLVRRDVENYADMKLEHYEMKHGQLALVGTEALDG